MKTLTAAILSDAMRLHQESLSQPEIRLAIGLACCPRVYEIIMHDFMASGATGLGTQGFNCQRQLLPVIQDPRLGLGESQLFYDEAAWRARRAEQSRWDCDRLYSAIDRFWIAVDRRAPTECWPWLRAVNGRGYGLANHNGERGAHRVAYSLAVGPIPKGLMVLHECDNPPCCNPAHLKLGTNTLNTQDKLRRGRLGATAKLNPDSVRAIRQSLAVGTPRSTLSARYNVTETCIRHIEIGHTWRHVE